MLDIQSGIADDVFFSSLHKSVTAFNNNFFRDFFLDANKMLCYQRAEDVRARVCVPVNCREAVLRAARGDSLLAGHLGVDRTFAAVSHNYYWTGLHSDVAHFVRSCTVCAAAKSSIAHGGRVIFIHTTPTFHQLGCGFDWSPASYKRGE